MESVTLEWKLEPLSPPLTNAEDATLCSEDLYWTEEKLNDEASHKNKFEIVTEILENLDNLEDLDEFINGNEDAFSSYWMDDDKMLPMYEESQPMEKSSFHHHHAHHQQHVSLQQQEPVYSNQSTQSLLTEFQNVFDSVNNNGSLTPPQSPQPSLIILQPAGGTLATPSSDHTYQVVGLKVQNVPLEYPSPNTPQTNVNHELAFVEELVRSRVETMVPSSPSSSSCSNYGDSSSDDPEWSTEGSGFTKKSGSGRDKIKPYSRNGEEKKFRKKEQNKNAATRYRLKKKAEVEEILGEEKGLLDTKTQLEGNVVDLQREIKCLKSLMRDLFKAKGLIN